MSEEQPYFKDVERRMLLDNFEVGLSEEMRDFLLRLSMWMGQRDVAWVSPATLKAGRPIEEVLEHLRQARALGFISFEEAGMDLPERFHEDMEIRAAGPWLLGPRNRIVHKQGPKNMQIEADGLRWGAWVIKAEKKPGLLLDERPWYDMTILGKWTPERLLETVFTVSMKTWATPEHVAGLVAALHFLLNPVGMAKSGEPKEISNASILLHLGESILMTRIAIENTTDEDKEAGREWIARAEKLLAHKGWS